MSNILLAYPNRANESALAGGSWVAGLPLANLQDRRIRKVARSADLALASTQFTVALPKARATRLVAIVGHSLSLAAQYRITWADDAAFTANVGTSGWCPVWPRMYDSADLDWEADNFWTGSISTDDAEGYPACLRFLLASPVYKRYWHVEIDDSGNAAGYVDLGRLVIADGWQPTYNLSYGSTIGWEDKTATTEALSGEEYFDPANLYRVMTFALRNLSSDEAMRRVFEMQRQLGISGELFVSYDGATQTPDSFRKSFLGRMRKLSPIEHPYFHNYSSAYEIKEIR